MKRDSVLFKTLSEINKHERDDNLKFEENSHKYTILSEAKNTFTSVTTWNHSHFSNFNADEIIEKMMKGKNWNSQNKYWGKTPEQIKEGWSSNAKSVSEAGTDLHFDIECFMNTPLHLLQLREEKEKNRNKIANCETKINTNSKQFKS